MGRTSRGLNNGRDFLLFGWEGAFDNMAVFLILRTKIPREVLFALILSKIEESGVWRRT